MIRPRRESVELACHPWFESAAVYAIRVLIQYIEYELALTYSIVSRMGQLRVPGETKPGIGRQLWRQTCCECFIAAEGRPEYWEFNLSPSREWAAYAFATYRKGVPLSDEGLNPRIAMRRFSDRLELRGSIRLDRLPALGGKRPLVLGLAAVIEDAKGGLSYWALRHPPGKPDFHHRDGFVLELGVPD